MAQSIDHWSLSLRAFTPLGTMPSASSSQAGLRKDLLVIYAPSLEVRSTPHPASATHTLSPGQSSPRQEPSDSDILGCICVFL